MRDQKQLDEAITADRWLVALLENGPLLEREIKTESRLAHFHWETVLLAAERLRIGEDELGRWSLP